MQEILGKAKTVRELLSVKYTIDYYQREYKWEAKQIRELVDDLTGAFLDSYNPDHPRGAVADYGRYFLGSIVISKKGTVSYIVDGQQRLTSLTLLLIYLRNLLRDKGGSSSIDPLILSVQYGAKSFNLHVDDRVAVMEQLYEGSQPTEEMGQAESVQTIIRRYADIQADFPEEIDDRALPYFVDWIIDNVHLVEITAYSDDDAYTVFETMNDRGLSLSPTDMLKGFLLARITEAPKRTAASDLWKQRTTTLRDLGKETESDFFKAWLRSQYAVSIRERKKGALAGDFDRIGTEFHRWVRDHADDKHDDGLVIKTSDDFVRFIDHDFDFFTRVYHRLMEASSKPIAGWERVLYNAQQGFTLQYMLMLAPLTPGDSEAAIHTKVRLVALYLDMLLTRRVWNYHRNTYSSMYYGMFIATRAIRGLDPVPLAERLTELFRNEQSQEENKLAFNTWLPVVDEVRKWCSAPTPSLKAILEDLRHIGEST